MGEIVCVSSIHEGIRIRRKVTSIEVRRNEHFNVVSIRTINQKCTKFVYEE